MEQNILVLAADLEAPMAAAHAARLSEQLSTASDAAEARACIAEDFKLCVVDLGLPPSGGLELLREINRRWPQRPLVAIGRRPATQLVVEAMRAGATNVIDLQADGVDSLSLCLRSLLDAKGPATTAEPVAVAAASQDLLKLAAKVASSTATMMLSGESGVGKEVIARYIHVQSPRAEQPFTAVNCAAIPENMLEAMLFGYEKGAFTGATESRAGKFEQANGGTLLLDEVTEMPLALQAKLLRVLQEKEVERLGGKQAVRLDVRVIATSNRSLRRAVTTGEFREDLYYRLNVFPLQIPPLRDRAADIVPLAKRFISQLVDREPMPRLTEKAEQRLQAYHWPGNVRELHNVIQRAMILCEGGFVREGDLHFEAPALPPRTSADLTAPIETEHALGEAVVEKEGEVILAALQATSGKRKQAAEQLGISPRTLRYKLAKLRDAGYAIP